MNKHLWIVVLLAFVMAAPMLAGTVRADSTVTFTSTADFDTGNKSDLGNTWFAQNGAEQPSQWAAHPRAWEAGGKLFTVWQGSPSLAIYAASYDRTLRAWSGPFTITASNPLGGGNDDHGAPSIGITNDGFLHVFCCAHSSASVYYRSNAPYDASAWTLQPSPTGATHITYPNVVVQPNGTMYLLFRKGDLGAGGFPTWAYVMTTDSGTTWTAPTVFVDFGDQRSMYPGNLEVVGTRVWFAFSRVVEPADQRTNLFVACFDLSNGHVYGFQGTDLGVSMTEAEANTSALVTVTGADQVWFPALHLDASLNIYVQYLVGKAPLSPYFMNYNFTKYNGAAWSANVTITTTGHYWNMGDFRVLGVDNLVAYIPVSYENLIGGDMTVFTYNGAWTKGPVLMGHYTEAAEVTRNGNSIVFNERPQSWDANQTIQQDERLWAWDAGFLYDARFTSGSHGVETITDNPSTVSGSMTLANGLGEAFAYADADGFTWKWNEYVRTSRSFTSCSPHVAAGVLNFTLSTVSGYYSCGASSNFTLSGDFDVHVKSDHTFGGTDSGRAFCLLSAPGACSTGEPDIRREISGVSYQIETYAGGVNNAFAAFSWASGVPTTVGSSNVVSNLAHVWFRITRVGNVFTWYRSEDGAAWTLDETSTVGGIPSKLYVTLGAQSFQGTFYIAYSNFQVVSGTLSAGGYRTSGSWTSPTQTYVSDVPTSLTVGYTGASTSGYIDSVAIVDSTGAVIWQDGTDKTAGTTATYIVAGTGLHKNWAVRVALAGDGTATPTVTDISINLSIDPGCLATSSLGSTLMTIVPIVLLMAILLAIIGVFLARRGDGLSGLGSLNPTTTSVAVISVIVIVIIFVAVVITGLNLTGSLC